MPPRTGGAERAGVLTTIINTMASKKDSYKEGVTQNHQLSVQFADRLTTGGGLKETLLQVNKGEDEEPLIPEEDLINFFNEQVARLKALAESNAQRDRKADAFCAAITKLPDEAGDDDNGNEYDAIIERLMKEETDRMGSNISDSTICKEMADSLGEKGVDPDDDDEIEVERHDSQNDAKCKCPITFKWMEDPVKNTQCGHTYSKEGILNHIRTFGRSVCKCPFPGCNQQVKQQDLEADYGMARLVKRIKRQAENEEEQQKKMSQVMEAEAMEFDDLD